MVVEGPQEAGGEEVVVNKDAKKKDSLAQVGNKATRQALVNSFTKP